MGSCCRTEVDAIVLADFHSARNCFSFGPHTSVVRYILEFFWNENWNEVDEVDGPVMQILYLTQKSPKQLLLFFFIIIKCITHTVQTAHLRSR